MTRPRLWFDFILSLLDKQSNQTKIRIADSALGELRQPSFSGDVYADDQFVVPAADATSLSAGTYNKSLLDGATHRDATGNYLVVVKTDAKCHIAVSNGLNYGDAWNQTSGVYNNLIKSTDAFVSGWGFLTNNGSFERWFLLPDYIPPIYASALLNGALVRFYKYTHSTGLYTPISYIAAGADMSYGYIQSSVLMQDNGAGDYYTAFNVQNYSPFGSFEMPIPNGQNLWNYADENTWAADDRIAYSIASINRIYGNLLVMKCDNPINLAIINTSAADIAGRVYLIKQIDEME